MWAAGTDVFRLGLFTGVRPCCLTIFKADSLIVTAWRPDRGPAGQGGLRRSPDAFLLDLSPGPDHATPGFAAPHPSLHPSIRCRSELGVDGLPTFAC